MTGEFPGATIIGLLMVLWFVLFPVMPVAQLLLCAIPRTRTRAIASLVYGVSALLFCFLAELSLLLWDGESLGWNMIPSWGAVGYTIGSVFGFVDGRKFSTSHARDA